jgi:hypothetical protein
VSVYRAPAEVKPLPECVHTKRCCGQCHPAVGGCVYGVHWPEVKWISFVTRKRIDAGLNLQDQEGRPKGTPPCRWCEAHQRWEIER